MATQVQNAKAIIDALLDSKGKAPSDAALASTIVERFTNTIDGAESNEEKAGQFNSVLVKIVRSTMRAHVERIEASKYEDAIAAAGAAAEGDL